jgi:hypothetical protein
MGDKAKALLFGSAPLLSLKQPFCAGRHFAKNRNAVNYVCAMTSQGRVRFPPLTAKRAQTSASTPAGLGSFCGERESGNLTATR